MTATATSTLPADMVLHIHHEIEIEAPPQVAFEALLEQLGPANGTQDGNLMPMKLELPSCRMPKVRLTVVGRQLRNRK